MKFNSRKEQRHVIETVSAILLSLIPHLKDDEAEAVRTAIRILQETEVDDRHDKEKDNEIIS